MKASMVLVFVVLLGSCIEPERRHGSEHHHGDPDRAERHDPSRAERALIAEGFTEIRLTGPAWFGCSDDDSVVTSSTFEAVNRDGQRVEGTVCCGLFLKGCTVRW